MNSTVPLSHSSRAPSLLFVLIVLLLGCGAPGNSVGPGPTGSHLEAWRYFPLNVGDTYVYQSNDGNRITFTTVEAGPMEGGQYGVFNVLRSGITQEYIFWTGDNLQRSVENNPNTGNIVLSGPLVIGRQWRQSQNNNNDFEYTDATILDTSKTIQVTAGTFNCLEVQAVRVADYPNVGRTVDTSYFYYARDVGEVKWTSGGLEVELREFTPAE